MRCSTRRWDSVWTRRLLPRDVPAAVERELGLGRLDRQGALGVAPGLQRGGGLAGGGQRLGPRRPRLLVAGEEPVDLVVVQAHVRADERAVEGRPDDLRPPQLELHRHREAVDLRAQRAGVAGQRLGQHRLGRAGDVDARRAAVGLAVDGRARPHERADVGDVHPDAPVPVAEALCGDRVVEVLGGRRVDREGRQRRQVAARRVGGARAARRPRAPPGRRRRGKRRRSPRCRR